MSQLFFGGVSGSRSPASMRVERSFERPEIAHPTKFWRHEFGTLTTALGLVIGDTGIMIDQGTGISNMNEFWKGLKLNRVVGLQTHSHGDHRIGIWNNQLLFKKDLVEAIYTPAVSSGLTFRQFVERDFNEGNWTIRPETFGATLTIKEFVPGDSIDVLGGIATSLLYHPGGMKDGFSAGFKIPTPCGPVVIATDTELAPECCQEAYAKFVDGAYILYADLQFRKCEYDGQRGVCGNLATPRKGWGHSTPEMLVSALKRCTNVPKKIIIGHHDPERSDADLKGFEAEVHRLLSPFDAYVRFAREGDVFNLC